MSAFPASRRIALPPLALPDGTREPGITLAVHDAGSGPAVVMSHGFPELGYSWRHQFDPLIAAGFRAIAPDQRGYGDSDAPEPIESYDIHHLCGDLVGLLDALGIKRAVFVGHDWGGFVVWAMPVLHPERVAGVVGVCTPYMPFPSVAVHAGLVDGDIERQYVAWFQAPGVAEEVMDPNVRVIFDRLMRCGVPPEQMLRAAFADGKLDMNPFLGTDALPRLGEPVMTPEELEIYCATFERTGFRGGIHWYRNIDRNRDDHPAVGTVPLTLPCLMLMAEWDPALSPALAASMPERCSDLEMHTIAGAGHWVQQEKGAELNARLVDWLRRRF